MRQICQQLSTSCAAVTKLLIGERKFTSFDWSVTINMEGMLRERDENSGKVDEDIENFVEEGEEEKSRSEENESC